MKLTLRQIRKIILGLALVVLVGGLGYRLGEQRVSLRFYQSAPFVKINRDLPVDKQGQVDFALFWQVWDRLQASYLDKSELDPQKMVYGAISGMVAAAGDPYTYFLPPKENNESKARLRGDFEGVGIEIGYDKNGQITVISPLSGTPAESAGIKAGDLIVKITDERTKVDRETTGMTLQEAVDLIRGPKGTLVKLTIARKGVEKPFEVSLKRDTIIVKSVELKFETYHGKKIAILKLSQFGERTYNEWQTAVNEIKKQKASGVILDLRNNPGGFLQGAVYIGSEFIKSGVLVWQDQGIAGRESFSASGQGHLLSEPLVVLINKGSASASEIVAGALQEKGRAKLVGEQSFGKGTVQEAQDLPNGAGLHVTVARWLLPSGKSIDKEGVKPDFEIKVEETNSASETQNVSDQQLQKALDLLAP